MEISNILSITHMLLLEVDNRAADVFLDDMRQLEQEFCNIQQVKDTSLEIEWMCDYWEYKFHQIHPHNQKLRSYLNNINIKDLDSYIYSLKRFILEFSNCNVVHIPEGVYSVKKTN